MTKKALPKVAPFALAFVITLTPTVASAQQLASLGRARAGGRAGAAARLLRRMSMSVAESDEGTRVRITSDAPLEGVESYTDAGRLFLLIPEADAKVLAPNGAAGRGFARVYHEHDGRVTSYASNASAEFDLYVPRNATLFVSSGDGRLRVEGVNGELELRTGDGSIDVAGARGRLRAETGDGRIRVEDFDGEADARTGDGRITLDGNFRALAARTGDGTIALSLPEGVNATVETNAESVSNDGVAVAETEAESRVRRWRIGSGGQLFTLRTGDGQIILRRR